jgi:hypothetical protein
VDKKLIKYNNADTRYGFMIQDSDEYNTTIYPLRIQELCPKFKDPVWPRGVGCGGQRYEHCKHLNKYDKESLDCGFFIYDLDDYAEGIASDFLPKKLNNNSFIDKSRISVAKYPQLHVDDGPDPIYPVDSRDDTSSKGTIPNPIYLKITGTDNNDKVEHFTSNPFFQGINMSSCSMCIIIYCILYIMSSFCS